jgi:serine phosphatase RsbU (regulator of sigma subunit)
VLITNVALLLVLLLVVAWLRAQLKRHQSILVQQNEQLRCQRDAIAAAGRQTVDEMRAARALQDLLPGPLPEHAAFEVGYQLRPATILGGDSVDFAVSPDRRVSLVVADVSGKGAPAALAAAVLTGLLQRAPARYDSPAATLSYLNRQVVGRLPGETFITAFYAVLDAEAGRMTYASVGHEPALLIRRNGEAESLMTGGLVLGVAPHAEFTGAVTALLPGDLVLSYTDGITDLRLRIGGRFGSERLHQLLRMCGELPCPVLVERVLSLATNQAAEIPDDITLVAVRFLGNPSHERRLHPPSPERESGSALGSGESMNSGGVAAADGRGGGGCASPPHRAGALQ